MSSAVETTPTAAKQPVSRYDAVIIGAGVTGLYQLHRIRQLGLSVRLYDDGSGVGGTWHWNRYPGCRFDSESETYGYSFSPELAQEWDWKEHFSGQPENERYLNFVADKFNLRSDIQLNSRIVGAAYDKDANRWDVRLKGGEQVQCTFLIAAVGILSADFTPPFEGTDRFKGMTIHTGRWPKEGVDLKGKRVAVIGTGPTGVQLITEIAKEVGHLTVFQRTPNYCAPLRNGAVSPETQARFKASYPEIHKRIKETPAGFIYDFDYRYTMQVPKEERLKLYEELWAKPGFSKWLANFHDIMTDRVANEDFAEFVRGKIRERVNDPKVAEKLIPRDHPFGSKRIPLESGYYEAYNRPNVELISLRETPIERVTEKGIKTTDKEYEFDVIIYATGFDAVSGSLTRMDIRGLGGQTFKDRWANGPRSYLGLQTAGFPNFFMAINSAFCNYPVCGELVVEWISDAIDHIRKKGYKRMVPTPAAEDAWVEHANELAKLTLLSDTTSWFMGSNIPGKKRALVLYANTAPNYRKKVNEVAANGYEGFELS
jgi:cation diffusion facilitator CzcD-associated flavoprotein CzcO